jgi:hypothetical protein
VSFGKLDDVRAALDVARKAMTVLILGQALTGHGAFR